MEAWMVEEMRLYASKLRFAGFPEHEIRAKVMFENGKRGHGLPEETLDQCVQNAMKIEPPPPKPSPASVVKLRVASTPSTNVVPMQRIKKSDPSLAALAAEMFDKAPSPARDQQRRNRIELLSYADLKACVVPPYLVDGLLVSDGLTSVIGEPKAGKSYWVLPQALSVATGRSFFDHKVKRGKVAYVCSEGGRARFRQRVDAWLQHHKVDPRELEGRFVLIPTPIRLLNEADAEALLLALGDSYDLAIYDTLARTMGGNENDTADMNAYVDALDHLRGAGANGTQIVVHHTGKDASRGGRGSNALLGAVEREFIITKPQHMFHVAKIGHDRHGDGTWREGYRFKPVDIHEDGPWPGVLVRDNAATEVFLDPRNDALIAACGKAPDKVISIAQAIEVIWEAGKVSTPDYKEDSARRWLNRIPKAPEQPHAATGLQRTKDGVRLVVDKDEE
jgi:hypothetical protein